MNSRIKLGITLGDINGIGPEIALNSVYRECWPADMQLILIGPYRSLAEQARAAEIAIPELWSPGQDDLADKFAIWDPDPTICPEWEPGKIRADASLAAHVAICSAAKACMAGDLHGMVTAPICKEGFLKAGIDVPGHTELLAELTGSSRFGMLLAGGGLRVMLATRHLPLKKVSENLTQSCIEEAIELVAEGLPWLGVERSKIGVCGLNPHAGDGGALGDEECLVITPAIEAARGKGIDVDDVVPADVIFHKALRGEYDAVVAMYHDQGLGPLKMIGFDEGINVTLGLPIVRTSPDHGTAFDIAGQGRAKRSSMVAAIKLAGYLARKPNPWLAFTQT